MSTTQTTKHFKIKGFTVLDCKEIATFAVDVKTRKINEASICSVIYVQVILVLKYRDNSSFVGFLLKRYNVFQRQVSPTSFVKIVSL